MSIFVGSNEVSQIFVGSTEVKEVYQGSNLVWSYVPDIDFSPSSWTALLAGAVWTLTKETGFGSNPAATFNTTYVNLPADLLGTFPSYTYGGTNMEANNLSLLPSTTYTVEVDLSLNTVSFLRIRVLDNSGSTLSTNTYTGTGTKTLGFTTDATGNTDIHIQSRLVSGTVDGDIRVTRVELSR